MTESMIRLGKAEHPVTARCAKCGQLVGAEQSPVQIAAAGLPQACAIIEGLGVPLVDLGSLPMVRVMCDGTEVDRCVGFDRPNGVAWRYQTDGGAILRRGDEFLIEKVQGVVTLKNMGERT
jgi:hypothetical protein